MYFLSLRYTSAIEKAAMIMTPTLKANSHTDYGSFPHFWMKLIPFGQHYYWLPWWPDGKASACNPGDLGSIPGLGRSPGEGNGNPLQCSCLENPMDRGA